MEAQSLAVIDIPEHCGNAPRKLVIRDFLVALYSGDLGGLLEYLADNVRWEVVGSHQLQGSAAVHRYLSDQPGAVELKLNTVITHGTECAADGKVTQADGKQQYFNHVLVFTGHTKTAKIKALRSYIIPS